MRSNLIELNYEMFEEQTEEISNKIDEILDTYDIKVVKAFCLPEQTKYILQSEDKNYLLFDGVEEDIDGSLVVDIDSIGVIDLEDLEKDDLIMMMCDIIETNMEEL